MSLKAGWRQESPRHLVAAAEEVAQEVDLNSGDRLARCQAIARYKGAAVEPGTEYGRWRLTPLVGRRHLVAAAVRDDLTLEQLESELGLTRA